MQNDILAWSLWEFSCILTPCCTSILSVTLHSQESIMIVYFGHIWSWNTTFLKSIQRCCLVSVPSHDSITWQDKIPALAPDWENLILSVHIFSIESIYVPCSVFYCSLNREHPQSRREQKITDGHFGCHLNLSITINFHIYKGQPGTFMETVTTLGMSLSRILFGWQEHLDTMAWQDVSATALPTGGEAPGSGFGVRVLEKFSPVRILSSDSEESDCLGWKNQNPEVSPAWLASLVRGWLCSNGSKWSKNVGPDAKSHVWCMRATPRVFSQWGASLLFGCEGGG